MALAGLVGAASVRLQVGGSDPSTPRLRRITLACAILAGGALLLLGWAQFAAFRDPFAPWREDAALLLSSAWGTRWQLALAGVAGVLVGHAVRPLYATALILAPILAAYPAFSGHAAASGEWTPLAMAADWVHVLAAGTWVGALSVLLLSSRDQPNAPRDGTGHRSGPLLVRLLDRFSVQARVSVGLLVLTGGFASWLHLPGPSALWATPYGRILGAKVILVVGMMAMGAWNWRVLSAQAHAPGGAARLLRLSRVEAAVGLTVLALTGWLTGVAPPPP